MRENLAQWDFVLAAYLVALPAIIALLIWSWYAMRRAEKRREDLKRK